MKPINKLTTSFFLSFVLRIFSWPRKTKKKKKNRDFCVEERIENQRINGANKRRRRLTSAQVTYSTSSQSSLSASPMIALTHMRISVCRWICCNTELISFDVDFGNEKLAWKVRTAAAVVWGIGAESLFLCRTIIINSSMRVSHFWWELSLVNRSVRSNCQVVAGRPSVAIKFLFFSWHTQLDIEI